MAVLRPDPDLYDVEGWERRLALLHAERKADPDDPAISAKIDYAEVHLAAIRQALRDASGEAATEAP